MHSRHAFLPLWDDHEFRNNYDKTGWTFPGVVRPRHPAVVQQKKAWAYRAWFEHMPVPRFAGDPLRTYRSLRLGRTVELFAEDSRQYRDDQGCHDSIDHIVCTSADEPGRSMLGSTQLSWLTNGLRTSSARWKLLANQNMLMGMVVAGNGTRAWMDSWDGYGAERTTLLSSVAGNVSDFVVVTGDDHDGYAGELWNTGFAPGTTSGAQVNPAGAQRAGVEFVVPSLTSTNTGDGGVPRPVPRSRTAAATTPTSSTPTWLPTATESSRPARPTSGWTSEPSTASTRTPPSRPPPPSTSRTSGSG